MMRSALRAIGAHSESTLMIGDRMDTDVIAGLEAGLATILVMTGISTLATVEQYPFRPSLVINSVADLIGRTADPFARPGEPRRSESGQSSCARGSGVGGWDRMLASALRTRCARRRAAIDLPR